MISKAPARPTAASEPRIARGALRRGSSVSSASAPAVSKPYITNEGTSAEARNGPR